MNYHAFTPDTGTMELPSIHRGRPLAEQPTTELAFPWFIPSPPVRYQRPNRLRRLLGSPFVRHVKAATNSAFYPAVLGAGVLLAFFLLHYFQGLTPVTGGIR